MGRAHDYGLTTRSAIVTDLAAANRPRLVLSANICPHFRMYQDLLSGFGAATPSHLGKPGCRVCDLTLPKQPAGA